MEQFSKQRARGLSQQQSPEQPQQQYRFSRVVLPHIFAVLVRVLPSPFLADQGLPKGAPADKWRGLVSSKRFFFLLGLI